MAQVKAVLIDPPQAAPLPGGPAMQEADSFYAVAIVSFFPELSDSMAPEDDDQKQPMRHPMIEKVVAAMTAAHNGYGPGMQRISPPRLDRLDRSFFLVFEREEASQGIHIDSTTKELRTRYYQIRAGNQHVLLHPYYGL